MLISRRYFNLSLLGGVSAGISSALVKRPKLLVLVLLEQFCPDEIESLSPSLRPAGFRRLLSGGAHFPDCRHLASTFSGSSLTTLATGSRPGQKGSGPATWFDRATRRPVPASSESLLATTLCAQVTAAPATRGY